MRASLVALVVVALGTALPAAADAGSYDVVACDAAPGGADNSWIASARGPHMYARSGCAAGSGLAVSNLPGAGAPAGGEQAWATFWAPAGAKVASVTFTGGYWRPGSSEPGAEDYSAELVDAEVGLPLDGCTAATKTRCYAWYSSPRTVSVPPTGKVAFVASCWGGRCRDGLKSPAPEFGAASAAVRMTSLSVRVTETTVPAVAVTGGDITGGWVRGTRTVAYHASDAAGVKTVRTQVDGTTRATDTMACDYTRPAPCAASVDRSPTIDTTSLADGAHTLRVEAVDAAANVAATAPATIRVDNSAPTVSVTGAGSPESPHPGPITVALDARDTASGMGGGQIAWKLDDDPSWTIVDGDEATVSVEGDGEHRLTYHAVDAAGNRSGDGTRTIAIRRPLEPSPRDPGPGFAARTTNPGTSFTAASRFGEPCPSAATLTADRTAALNGRTLLVGFPLPGAPDCTVASATLRVYVTAHDATPIAVTRASSSWSPAAVTWDTRPGIVGTAVTTPPPAQPGWVEWDASAQVAGLYRHGDNGLHVSGAASDRPAQLVVRFAE